MNELWKIVRRIVFVTYLVMLHVFAVFYIGENIISRYLFGPAAGSGGAAMSVGSS